MTVERGVSFADLHLWFAGFLAGFCLLAADEGTGLAAERGRWVPFGVVRDDSFAYLVTRPTADDFGVEFGARAYGPHGLVAATAMVEQIRAWDLDARGGPEPTFAYWPAGPDPVGRPSGAVGKVAALIKTHGVLTICWPAAS